MKKIAPQIAIKKSLHAINKFEKSLRRREKLKLRGPCRQKIVEKPIVIIPPSNFSFSDNYEATVRCLQDLKNAVFAKVRSKRHPFVSIDMTYIDKISATDALVLAAEIDRWRRFRGKGIRPTNLSKWNPEVKGMLRGLGFFELLDVSPEHYAAEKVEEGAILTVMEMISNTALDQRLLASLSHISEYLHNDPTVYGALVEAAYNVTKHAYPDNYKWRYPPIVKGWWATASFEPESNCVKFAVYDQGVGIAETLPRWEGWEKVRSVLSLLPYGIGEALNDEANMIKAALEVDRTSLSGGHGKGLQDIVEVVRNFEGADVRIFSGKGTLHYTQGRTMVLKDHSMHIGGTLIEWTIPVMTKESW